MLMGDFITLVQHRLPVKVVVFNNGLLGFVDLEMKAAGLLEAGTRLENPNFAAMANAMGVFARRVEKPGELGEAVQAVLAHDGPALLDVVVNQSELAMPPHVTLEQIGGFGLWMAKAVLNGRADEVVDVARANLPFLAAAPSDRQMR